MSFLINNMIYILLIKRKSKTKGSFYKKKYRNGLYYL